MAGVFVIRIAAVPAIGFAPVLTAGVFLPASIGIAVVGIVIGRCAAAGAGFRATMLRIGIFTPRTGCVAVISIIGCGISTGAARCRPAVLRIGMISPRAVAHAVAGIIIVRRAAVSAGTCAPMLTGRILLPRAIVIAVTTRIDCFGFCLTASAGVRTVAVAGTGGSLLILKNPCVAAAVRAGTGTVTTSAVTLIGVSAKVLDVVAEITLIIVCMAARRMCDFNVCALERILSA